MKVAYQNGLRFFYGNNEEDLLNDLDTMKKRYEKKGDSLRYDKLALKDFKHKPDQFNEHLLRQLCSNFRSLTDAGLCWIEPCDIDGDTFDDIEESFDDADISMTLDEFKILFAAWAMEIMTSEYAIGSDIPDSTRRNLTAYRQRLGIENETELPGDIVRGTMFRRFTLGHWAAEILQSLTGNGTELRYFEFSTDTMQDENERNAGRIIVPEKANLFNYVGIPTGKIDRLPEYAFYLFGNLVADFLYLIRIASAVLFDLEDFYLQMYVATLLMRVADTIMHQPK